MSTLHTLTSSPEETLERARDIAQLIAPHAQASHQSARFSNSARQILWEQGFLGLTIPREDGGLGADPLTQALCIWEISKGDSAVANWLSMHTTTVRFIAELGTEEQRGRLFYDVRARGGLIAASTSEPGASFRDKFDMRTVFTPVLGGYRVQGQKHFCSIGAHADYYFVMGMVKESRSAREGAITAVIKNELPGVTIVKSWRELNPLGMRATASDSVSLNNVFVPDRNVIGSRGELLASGLFTMFAICYAALYSAIGMAALEFTQEYLKAKKLPPARAEGNQDVLAEMRARVGEVKLSIREACNAFSQDRANAVLPIARAKLKACAVSMETVLAMMQMAGGNSIFEAQFPYGRWLRDAATGLLMPPSQNRCLEVVSRIEKGEKGITLLEFL